MKNLLLLTYLIPFTLFAQDPLLEATGVVPEDTWAIVTGEFSSSTTYPVNLLIKHRNPSESEWITDSIFITSVSTFSINIDSLEPLTPYQVSFIYSNVSGNSESTFFFTTISSVGVNEEKETVFNFFPNPTHNIITIETTTANGIYQLQDITGKQLLSGSVNATKFNLDISAFSKGIYLLSLIDGEQQVNRKIVKE